MNFINIYCYDNIGLTIDNKIHMVSFLLPQSDRYNITKIKILCINKLNEFYNPKYPYFYCNLNNLIGEINCNIKNINDTMIVELYSIQNIYKLKILGIKDIPIYFICKDNDLIRSIIEMIELRHSNCNFGKLYYGGIEMHIDLFIKNYSLSLLNTNVLVFKKNKLTYPDILK